VLERVFRDRDARELTRRAADGAAEGYKLDTLVGRSPQMVEVYKRVGQFSAGRATVLIRGKTGTGKAVVARAFHYNSADAAEPLVAVNCTAVPESLLESELFGHVRGAFTGAVADRRTPAVIAAVRHSLLQARDNTFVDLIKLLATGENCSPEVLKELGRTPAIRKRMARMGFIPTSEGGREGSYRPTRSREVLAMFGVELPKPPKPRVPLPRVVEIGKERANCEEVCLDRAAFFRRVWSEPMWKLGPAWGVSDRGFVQGVPPAPSPRTAPRLLGQARSGQEGAAPQAPGAAGGRSRGDRHLGAQGGTLSVKRRGAHD